MSRYDPIRDESIAATSGGLNPNIPALSQGDRLDALLDRQRAFDDDYRADRERRRGPPRYGDVFEDDYDDDVYDEGLSPRGMLSPQDMFSPQGMMSPQGVMSPPGMRHGEPMGDIARTRAAMEDPLVSSARDGYEREAREEYERDLDEQMFANMGMGMGREQELGMDIIDRDFDLYGDPREEFMESIEREPDPMDAFYGEPQLNPRRRRRGREVTSGVRLPPGAGQGPPMPREALLEGHRMGLSQADMLMGARPDPRLEGTPMPGAFLEDDMGPPMRRRR
jgi:hypothetical protein